MRTQTMAVVGLLALVTALGWFALRSPSGAAGTPLPQPNGYDTCLKAGQMLAEDPPTPAELNPAELRLLVAQNAAAVGLVRTGLQQQCRVPLSYSIGYATNHMADLSNWKRIVRAFVAEGKLAEAEGRNGDAARSYLDAIRFGHECCRGGVIIDVLVGVACQSIGCQSLQKLAGQLELADCSVALHQLEEMDTRAEPAKVVMDQERAWSARTFGWRGRLAALVMRKNMQQVTQKTVAKVPAQQKAERLLMIALAERAYELEHGAPPKNVSELVPAYLKTVPRDPVDATKLIELPSVPAGKHGGERHGGARFQRA